MPLDERDAKFEKALRRHFRGECPDAETLAAYQERGLSPEELIFWKKHISGCDACQEILAQLETTERVVAAETDAAAVGAQERRDRDSTLPISAPAASYGSARSGLAAPASMPRRRGAWKWAAPAGAIAAGLLVWLSVSELREPSVRTQAPVQVAENRAEAESQEPPAEARKEQAQPKTLNGTASREPMPGSSAKRQSAAPPAASRAQAFNEPMAKKGREDNEENGRTAEARGNPGEKKQAEARESEQQRLKDQIASDEKIKAAEASKSIGAVTQRVEVQNETAAANAAPAPAAPPPPPAATAEARDAKKNAAAGLAAQQGVMGGVRSEYKREAYLLDADASMLRTVISVDGKSTWRLGPSGQILLLDKTSAGWLTQSSGVTVGLTSGSAPTEKICWVAGREGTILLTVDGGEHWRRVASPIRGDIGGITATDGKHAVVWDAGNGVKYETSDAGVTWKARTP